MNLTTLRTQLNVMALVMIKKALLPSLSTTGYPLIASAGNASSTWIPILTWKTVEAPLYFKGYTMSTVTAPFYFAFSLFVLYIAETEAKSKRAKAALANKEVS